MWDVDSTRSKRYVQGSNQTVQTSIQEEEKTAREAISARRDVELLDKEIQREEAAKAREDQRALKELEREARLKEVEGQREARLKEIENNRETKLAQIDMDRAVSLRNCDLDEKKIEVIREREGYFHEERMETINAAKEIYGQTFGNDHKYRMLALELAMKKKGAKSISMKKSTFNTAKMNFNFDRTNQPSNNPALALSGAGAGDTGTQVALRSSHQQSFVPMPSEEADDDIKLVDVDETLLTIEENAETERSRMAHEMDKLAKEEKILEMRLMLAQAEKE